ncbi:MAG: hypothetical protein JWR90_1706 [Marmoricola sp.]|jgi:hypothetical protein|nr:hypothetical protein [Marmoricola sp.]
MSYTSFDLARAQQDAFMVEAEESRRAGQAAAARRWQRRSERLAHKAERVSRKAERAASRARLAVARAI